MTMPIDPADAARILGRYHPVELGPQVERSRVIRRGATITSRIDHDHLHRVTMARIAAGLPRWPVTQLVRALLITAVLAACGTDVTAPEATPAANPVAGPCVVQYVSRITGTDTTFTQVAHHACPACLPDGASVLVTLNTTRVH
jgi:hypothetical protein